MDDLNSGAGGALFQDDPAATSGNDGAGSGSTGSGGTGADDSWLDGLSEDNRQVAEAKGFKSPDDAFAWAKNAETQMSRGQQLPSKAEEIEPEQWDKYARRNQRPDTADAYEFTKPKAAANITYDVEMSDAFKPIFHKAALNKHQARIVHDEASKFFIVQQQKAHENSAASVNSATKALEAEYGSADGPKFKDNVKQAFQNIKRQTGLLEAYLASGILVPHPGGGFDVTDPHVVMAHANMARSTMTESTGFDGLGGTSQPNPFKKENEHITQQGTIIRDDPDLARSMIREAGGKPEEFGL